MQDLQSRREWYLLIVAILANIVLCIALVFLFTSVINQPSEPDAASTEEDMPATEEPTATATMVRDETLTVTLTPTLTPSPVLTIPSTNTPEPTRREILEPTKPPYVFPTPINILPTPRGRPTPTRGR